MRTPVPVTRVLIVTGQHFADAPRRVDLHFIADSLRRRGAEVDFLVWRLSPVSRWLKDGRHGFARQHPLNRWQNLDPGLSQFIWLTPIHPMNLGLPILNRLADPFFARFGRLLPATVRDRLGQYSHVLIESGPSPLLVPVIRECAPKARLIYHAADRLSTIGVPPVVERVMAQTIRCYDLIHILAEAMRGDFPRDAPILCLPHGIDRRSFDHPGPNPYAGPRQVISVGDMLFDADAIEVMASAFPDWTFHLFGRKAVPLRSRANVVAHGEQPFQSIVPHIAHADLGLAPYRNGAGADYLSQSSLKMIQYSYCRLPIVAPRFASAGRDHVFAYEPGEAASITAAFAAAIASDRHSIDRSGLLDWDETTDAILAAA